MRIIKAIRIFREVWKSRKQSRGTAYLRTAEEVAAFQLLISTGEQFLSRLFSVEMEICNTGFLCGWCVRPKEEHILVKKIIKS